MVFGIGLITCGECNVKNPKDAKFCSACGVSLKPKCPNPQCLVSLESGDRFCPKCGTAIEEPDLAEKQAILEAQLNEAEMQTGIFKRQAEIKDQVRVIQTQDEISEKNSGDTLWKIDRQRVVRKEEATHEDALKSADRTQETERQARLHTKENLRDDIGIESEVKAHGRGEEFEDVKHGEAVKDALFEGGIRREGQIRDLDLKTKEQKRKLQMETMAGLIDLKGKKDDLRQKAANAEHEREMEKLIKVDLEGKKIDADRDLEGKRIDAGRDVEIAKADVEGSRKLIEVHEEIRKESKVDSKETLEMFKQFAEKNAELLAGGLGRRQEEIKKMAEKHSDQVTELALAKAKALGSATSKEGKESPKNQCPNPNCGAEVQPGSKFCVKCGKTLLA